MPNSKGEKVTIKSHGGSIEIHGITVATVNDKVQLQAVETWFDPMEMFRQIAAKHTVETTPDSQHDQADDGDSIATIVSAMAESACPVMGMAVQGESKPDDHP